MSGTEWRPSVPGGPDDPAEPAVERRLPELPAPAFGEGAR